jgi:hypothetical protein
MSPLHLPQLLTAACGSTKRRCIATQQCSRYRSEADIASVVTRRAMAPAAGLAVQHRLDQLDHRVERGRHQGATGDDARKFFMAHS